MNDTKKILEQLRAGELSVDQALLKLKLAPVEDLGFAKVDHHRALRQGAAQIAGILRAMLLHGERTVLVTRLSAEKAGPLTAEFPMDYHADARVGIVGSFPEPDGLGKIVVATGGTSDIPIAEEAAVTAEALGNKVTRLYDVGVSGVHRLLSHQEDIMSAQVIVAVAGMEGALPSVIGGLADCPVIAVPTSVGYGASLGGIAALLSMLNSCASGVSVVNIDNGFGAGYLANMINHLGQKS